LLCQINSAYLAALAGQSGGDKQIKPCPAAEIQNSISRRNFTKGKWIADAAKGLKDFCVSAVDYIRIISKRLSALSAGKIGKLSFS
jgi:hypothetical protein